MPKQAINSKHAAFATSDGSTIFEKFSYSAAARAGDFVYVAGQIGLNPDGSLPADSETQFRNAFDRLQIILKEAGVSLDDIVELVSYHVGLEDQGHLQSFIKVKNEFIKAPYPTWTILGIAALARPGLVVEIKAVAYTKDSR